MQAKMSALLAVALLFVAAGEAGVVQCHGVPLHSVAPADLATKAGVVTSSLFVSKDGSTPFTTIQQAVDAVQPTSSQWVRIHVAAGIYREKVVISKAFVLLEGEGQAQTSIEWSDAAPGAKTTNETATLSIIASDFMARHLTIKNTYDGGNVTAPAVALQVNGDRVAFYDCAFMSIQDTLSDLSGRHLYKGCLIQGAIDFIFGYGKTMFQDCELRTVQLPPGRSAGYLTAQGRPSRDDDSAFIFKNCTVGGVQQVYLGRGWRPCAQVVFYQTTMSSVVVPQGWDMWNGHVDCMNLVEAECTGPGADRSGRVPWSKGLTGTDPTVLQLVDPAYIDKDLWIEAQPQ